MAENFPTLMTFKSVSIGIQRTPKKINAKKLAPIHIIFKMQKIKDKEKILKDFRVKQKQNRNITYL